MKKLIISLLILFSMHHFTNAQVNRGENLENFKIAYFTKELELTSIEAKVFWPIYDEFQKELDLVRKDRRVGLKDAKTNISDLNEKELASIIDNEMLYRQKELDVEKKFHSRFKAILPVQKVARLYVAEQGYKRALLRKIQEARKN